MFLIYFFKFLYIIIFFIFTFINESKFNFFFEILFIVWLKLIKAIYLYIFFGYYSLVIVLRFKLFCHNIWKNLEKYRFRINMDRFFFIFYVDYKSFVKAYLFRNILDSIKVTHYRVLKKWRYYKYYNYNMFFSRSKHQSLYAYDYALFKWDKLQYKIYFFWIYIKIVLTERWVNNLLSIDRFYRLYDYGYNFIYDYGYIFIFILYACIRFLIFKINIWLFYIRQSFTKFRKK